MLCAAPEDEDEDVQGLELVSSLFPFHLFFPRSTLEHGFCAMFFQWYTEDVQMDACKDNHTVIRKEGIKVAIETIK